MSGVCNHCAQVNELAFTQDGRLFLQATDSGVEARLSPPALP